LDTNAQPSASLQDYLQLMRLDRPVGTLLLLWPTLAALAMAADGVPPLTLIVIFTLGTFLMRSAGCVINDYADRNVDGAVKRTKERPLVTGAISKKQALGLFALLGRQRRFVDFVFESPNPTASSCRTGLSHGLPIYEALYPPTPSRFGRGV
jgi:heme O synthase-like polyprenyltransferase